MYKCKNDGCEYSTATKFNYDRHINRKNPCVPQPFICPTCNYVFKQKQSLMNHVNNKICESKKCIIGNKNNNNNENIKGNVTNNNINNENNNVTNNNNIIITPPVPLVSFGAENLEVFTDKYYTILFNGKASPVPDHIKNIHFNEMFPQNHNVYMPNISKNILSTYQDGEWKDEDLPPTTDEMMDRGFVNLEIQFKKLKDDLPEKTVKKMDTYLNSRDDKKFKKQIKKETIEILKNKNNREIVKNNRKKIEEYNKKNNIKTTPKNIFSDPSLYNFDNKCNNGLIIMSDSDDDNTPSSKNKKISKILLLIAKLDDIHDPPTINRGDTIRIIKMLENVQSKSQNKNRFQILIKNLNVIANQLFQSFF